MSGGRPGAHAGRGAHPGFLPCPAASGQPGRPRHASGSQVRRHPDIRLLSDIARARGRRARPARHRHRQEPPALPGAFNRTAIASVARTRHKRALTCRPGRDQTCDLDYKAPDGSAGTRLANHSDCVEASQRPFAWAPFPARAAKPEPLEPERRPAPGRRHELTLIRRLYPRHAENRREPTGSMKFPTTL